MCNLLRPFIFSVSFYVVIGCSAQKVIIYESTYLAYLDYLENGSIKGIPEDFNGSEAIRALEDISGIESFTHYGYSDWKVPNKWNFRDWKDWYFINKRNIYFDENLNKFQSSGPLVALYKNPIEVYNEYLNVILNNNINSNRINDDHLTYAVYFFSNLTKREFNKSETFGFLPSENDISYLETWLQENSDTLIWDKESQNVKVKY